MPIDAYDLEDLLRRKGDDGIASVTVFEHGCCLRAKRPQTSRVLYRFVAPSDIGNIDIDIHGRLLDLIARVSSYDGNGNILFIGVYRTLVFVNLTRYHPRQVRGVDPCVEFVFYVNVCVNHFESR